MKVSQAPVLDEVFLMHTRRVYLLLASALLILALSGDNVRCPSNVFGGEARLAIEYV
jgi:hypothetical protein